MLGKVGWAVLGAQRMRSPRASQFELFQRLWRFFNRYYLIFKLREYYSNPFRIPVENLIFSKIVRAVRRKYPGYKPEIEIIDPGVIADILDSPRVVVVTVHNEVSTAIIEVLRRNGRPCSLMSIAADLAKYCAVLGGGERLNIINPDQDGLVLARRDIRRGRVFCCLPDAVEARPWCALNRPVIGKAAFEFARVMDVRLFYAVTHVSPEGTLLLQTREARKVPSRSTALELAEDFIDFLHATVSDGRRWRLAA
jgi:hypothetical protein